ncbi:hypothetical protein NDN08_005870 [Rhodosorus marinus]|uniref:RanBP-type and C3HC4-type zinc finger-containing protein 1 n=1 Tax=Rhodosorus marinus TaxID=101924 RepID=A0AAV8V563_9RHOD|nr:hypothetical protein NDN08_005870 [Rhodosorus marinus]
MEETERDGIVNGRCSGCGLDVPMGNLILHRLHCGGGGSGGRGGVEREPDEVECGRCTFANHAGAEKCDMCDAGLLEPGQTSDEGWQCSECTFVNSHENYACEMCSGSQSDPEEGSPGAERQPAPRGTPEGWICPSCTYLNSLDRHRCEVCQRPTQQIPTAAVDSDEYDDRPFATICSNCEFVNLRDFGPCGVCGAQLTAGSGQPMRMTSSEIDMAAAQIFGGVAGSLVGAAMGATLASMGGSRSTSGLLAGAGLGAVTGAGLGSLASASGQQMNAMNARGYSNVGIDFREMNLEEAVDAVTERETRPAASETITSLPTSTAGSSSNRENNHCVICIENFKRSDQIKHLPCLHSFHARCIDPWLERSGCCPVCKHAL